MRGNSSCSRHDFVLHAGYCVTLFSSKSLICSHHTVALVKLWPVHFTVHHPLWSTLTLTSAQIPLCSPAAILTEAHVSWECLNSVICKRKENLLYIRNKDCCQCVMTENICCSHRWMLLCAAWCSLLVERWCRYHRQTADQLSNQTPKKR